MKNKVRIIITIVILVLIACLIPFPDSNVNLSFYFDSSSSETDEDGMSGFVAYYSTKESPVMSQDKLVPGEYDKEHSRITFEFDREYAASITEIRIDFPAKEQLLYINGISISSGGAVKKNLDPSRFLTEANVAVMNDILGLSSLEATCNAAIRTTSEDPYIIFAEPVTQYIIKQQSKHIESRAVIIALLLCGFACYSKLTWQKHD